MYEAYVRRRDERLREGWRARMERKEAEVKALWAQLELTGRAGAGAERAPGGGHPTTTTTTTDDGAAAGDERKTERNDDDKRRSSDTALAPRRITGKKHARTRSFSSSITTNRSDAGRRRALSQEPPPSEPHSAAEARKDNRARPAGGAAATTGTARPRTSLRRKNSVKGHVSAAPKLPRSLPRRASSGGLEALSREAVLPIADAPASVQSSSSECAAHGETPNASPPRPFIVKDDSGGGGGGCAADERDASPESDRSEVVQAVSDGKPGAKNADVEELCEEFEKVGASPDKLGNPSGEITSDSETEPSYVYIINKDNADEHAMTISEPLKSAGSDDALDSDTRTNEENGEDMPAPADATAAEIATTNAEEAPARESSDESLFSVRSGLSARPSCSSRDQSIERLLEADAVLLRKKREERAEKSTPPKTPGRAGSRVSGAARSPRGTVRGFKKFLSFGKKNRGRDVTVIDCTSPSVPSLAEDDSTSGGWQSAGSIKPRMGSSDAASDDTDHGYTVSPRVSAACSLQSLVAASPAKSELAEIVPQEKSPKAPRSFFSFRSLNCGRG
ncbi:hypothetical protein PVAP13_1NG522800 [Panicum virgatum]|uniref:Uncharacterized protein n=2 Tax=Panicum virgatum TaxID=38727 RepID=A0A8T0X9D4_PANVG|nr:hypothetical protein PVAP13_1NG522800 [Panicum virgatum]